MDKSREQFEEWFNKEVFSLKLADKKLVNCYWDAWQASRVAVELPVICECCYSEEQISVSNEIYEALFEQGIGE